MHPILRHISPRKARGGRALPRPGRILTVLLTWLLCLAGVRPGIASSVLGVGPGGPNARQRQAACVLLIGKSAADSWPDFTIVTSLLQSSKVADDPAHEILGIDPDFRAQKITFHFDRSEKPDSLAVGVRVFIDVPAENWRELAVSYLKAVVIRFGPAFLELRENRSARLEDEIQAASAELGLTEKKLAETRGGLHALDAKVGEQYPNSQQLLAAPDRLRGDISSAVLMLQSAEQVPPQAPDITGRESRRLAAEAWQQVVDLREAKLAELRALAREGKADPVELAEFEARLAEAKARVLQAEPPTGIMAPMGRIVGAPPSANPASRERLIKERRGKLEGLQSRLRELEKLDLRRLGTKMDELQQEEKRLRDRRQALSSQLEKLRRQHEEVSAVTFQLIGS